MKKQIASDDAPRLACGHQQVLSAHRKRLASEGLGQPSAWCVTCNGWSTVVPENKQGED